VTREFLLGADEILRAGTSSAGGAKRIAWTRAAIYVAVFGSGYGALMGTFGGFGGDRALMILFSGIKVPLLLAVTFLVCIPSFFVLNTLLGVGEDFREAFQALVLTQAALTILLVSLAPVTLFWYASSADYNSAVLFNAFIFAVSSVAAQWLLRRQYQPLIARNPRHRMLLRTWLILFAFVGIQTAWILRPFIGHPAMPAQFFREEAWGNAYVAVAEKFREALEGALGSILE
jgi:hypothetical protein